MKTLLASLLFLSLIQSHAQKKPNIVFFFIDDMGWADLGYRNPDFESPHIDQLVKEGLDFPQTYIPCPTCSPSRAALLTGKHPAELKLVRHIPRDKKNGFDRFGRTTQKFNLWATDPAQFPCVNWLDLHYTTYAEALKNLGYYNAFFGKWHLGHEPYHPIHQGFHQQTGTANAGHPKSYHPPYFHSSEVYAEEKERYLTDKLTDDAVTFIKDYKKDKPFMLSFWYYSVHSPHHPRQEFFEHFTKKGLNKRQARYASMVKAVDESVGRVRQALKEKDLAKDTLILFLSDQGGSFQNGPFHGGKVHDTLYEGGARVPFIIHWPGVTKPGTTNNSIVQSTDLFPTLVEIAGGNPTDYKELDGQSILATIKENSLLNRGKPIYGYRAYEDLYGSAREGDWKLLTYRSGLTKLYNIANDPGEKTDLAKEQPDKVAELKKKFIAWEKQMGVEKYSGFPSP